MDTNTPDKIKNLPYTESERLHLSRKRNGFHVYLVQYLKEFKKQSRNEQEEVIANTVGIDITGDDESIDSTDSIVIRGGITHKHRMKVACHNWSKVLSPSTKLAWINRALQLNKRPIPGKLTTYPDDIGVGEDLGEVILESITVEWKNFVHLIKNCIMRRPRALLSNNEYTFGKERFKLLSQSYRVFCLTLLLRRILFGKEYDKLLKGEIVEKTLKTMVIHLASQKRVKNLLMVKGLTATEFEFSTDSVLKYQTCCGKVNLKMIDGRNLLGYILDEDNVSWTILLASNEVITTSKLQYCKTRRRYNYDNSNDSTVRYRITMYWPVRFLVNRISGNCKITLNRLAYKHNHEIISQFTS